MTRYFSMLSGLLFSSAMLFAADTTDVISPKGATRFSLFQKNDQLHFSVSYKGQKIVTASPLVALIGKQNLTRGVRLRGKEDYTTNREYPMAGAHALAWDRSNGARITLRHGNDTWQLDVRVYDNGTAYRMIFPGKEGQWRIPDEVTTFNLPADGTIWYHDMNMHYESVHARKQVSQLSEGEWVAPPATIRFPSGVYAAITEADLKGYSGMSLQANGQNGLVLKLAHHQPTSYPYRLRYSPEDTQRLAKPAAIEGTITTPWRVVMVGADLNAMVNNDLVQNLCPSPDPSLFPQGPATAWIKPGRAVWKYLNGGGEGTLAVMKEFSDDAAALGFEHNILEGFWARWKEGELKELVDYSKQKGVNIWLWKHSKSLRNAASRDSFFRLCNNLGVAGVKLDFFDHEAKEVVDLYESILQEAAKYKLLVNLHGANKPTGQAATYPNELVREAVKGMEASKLADRATHETTIPFTRWLAGPAEYTVLHFGVRRMNTTWAHQIASAAILHAPLLTYAAHPDTILANPAVDIIRNIPAIWDETIVLPPSEIGELAVYARRKGKDWFLAVMNGRTPRKINVPLNFLNGTYKALVAKDDEQNSASLLKIQARYGEKDSLEIDLGEGGGYIAWFSK
ncbi:MAG TPA: glycoside hydrolase family 97 catalytic domain-containing protein [Chitinophagaceae bacterium]